MLKHLQSRIYNPILDNEIDVDCGLVELLILLWNKGIETSYSCEGDNFSDSIRNFGYILFSNPEDVRKLLEIMKSNLVIDSPFYNHILNRWVYQIIPNDSNSVLKLSTIVRFPNIDIPLIVSVLKNQNAQYSLDLEE